MSSSIEIRPAPHIKRGRSVEQIMRHVIYALLPVCAFFIYQYGLSALFSLLLITLSCLLTEWLLGRGGEQAGSIADGSSIITGILLTLTLPPGFPLWMGCIGGVVAIAMGKLMFGGIGYNIFNPALLGRAFVQAAFPGSIASYTPSFLPQRFLEFIPSSLAWPFMQPPGNAAWIDAKNIDALTTATPLALWKFEGILVGVDELFTSLSGHMAVGPSPLLILLCGLYLAVRRFLDWRIPMAILGSAGLTAWILYTLAPQTYPNPLFMMLSGGLILGAVFMATDMATSPVTPRGMWVYGAVIGLLTVVIRYYSGLPEGVMYAILIGNASTPLIERYTQPLPFGKSLGKGLFRRKNKAATYSLNPGYISREDAAAVTPKKKILKNKPKREQ